jgi:enoyl-CoA hydratase/carnithine racemase
LTTNAHHPPPRLVRVRCPVADMTDLQVVAYEKQGPIATLRLNRPERLNAFGMQMRDELNACWTDVIDDPQVRVVILTGTGTRAFCAGRDIREQAERGGRLGGPTEGQRNVLGFFLVPEMDKPIITAVNGGAWGAGWYMVCGSDIAIAADHAVFAMSEVPTGVIGPVAMPVMMNIPWLPGSELALRGHQISAQRAYELGMVNYVLPGDQVMPKALELAEEIAALPPRHVQVTKRQLNMARPRMQTYQATVAFPEAGAYLNGLDDTREAAQAFAEKRKPTFRGR